MTHKRTIQINAFDKSTLFLQIGKRLPGEKDQRAGGGSRVEG